MAVTIIRKGLEDWKTDAWLVRKGRRYYVVSGVVVPFTGWEVLVFPANEDGQVTDWGEVAGGRGISHAEAIRQLAARRVPPIRAS